MSRIRPGQGMFGVKLVGSSHPEVPVFGRGGKPALMNFPDSPEGRRIAAEIPIGHRSLVYVMHPVKRFWAAIEYIKWDIHSADVLEEGTRAAVVQNAVELMEVVNPKYSRLWRCIRIVALIDDPRRAPTPDFGFSEGEVMRDLEEQDYSDLFNAVPWSWTDESS